MLEMGEISSLREIAQLEGLDNSYISRTTLAPDIVEAILDDCLPPNITQFDLVRMNLHLPIPIRMDSITYTYFLL